MGEGKRKGRREKEEGFDSVDQVYQQALGILSTIPMMQVGHCTKKRSPNTETHHLFNEKLMHPLKQTEYLYGIKVL